MSEVTEKVVNIVNNSINFRIIYAIKFADPTGEVIIADGQDGESYSIYSGWR